MAKQKQSPALVVVAILALIGGAIGIGYLLLQLQQPIPDRMTIKTDAEKDQAALADQIEYSLLEEERTYLWDLEHSGNVLNTFGFKEEVKAWQKSDRDALLEFFTPDFTSTIISQVENVDASNKSGSASKLSTKTDLLNVSRVTATSQADEVNGDAFVDWLLEFRSQFADSPAPRGKFYVKTLMPPAESDSDIWTATCVHRLWGESKSGGPLEFTISMTIETRELSEERLKQKSWFHRCEVEQVLFAQSTDTMFKELDLDQANNGIKHQDLHDNWNDELKAINTGGIYSCDFNKDGFADLYITDLKAGNRFYLGGSKGSFLDITEKSGLVGLKSMVAGFADLNNDGWEDLVMPASGRVFRNNEGQNFQEVTQLSNLRQNLNGIPPSFISGVVMADYNRDGLIDLYVPSSVPPIGSWLESRQPKIAANRLLKNNGDWTFQNVTPLTKTDGGGRSSFTAAWADVNDDRWPDLYVINEFGDGALYINREGKTFDELSIVDSPPDFGSMGLASGDINNDGKPDFYVSNMYSKAGSRIMGNMKARDYPETVKQQLRNMVAGSQLYQNEGELKFKALGPDHQVHAVGWSWGSAMADFDNDGWLDLHVMAGFMSRDRNKPDG